MPAEPPMPFHTDGCSMWPDGPWKGCCVEHDKPYWRGGTWIERLLADIELAACIIRRARGRRLLVQIFYVVMALAMFVGVRSGGSPWLPVPWRWGYGHHWPDYKCE